MSKSVFFKAKEIQEKWWKDPHSPAHRFVAEELDNFIHGVDVPLLTVVGSGIMTKLLENKLGRALEDLSDELSGRHAQSPLEAEITAVLEKNDGLCLDNEEERNKLARVLARELK